MVAPYYDFVPSATDVLNDQHFGACAQSYSSTPGIIGVYTHKVFSTEQLVAYYSQADT